MPNTPTKKPHWASTPEGKRKLRRAALKRWRDKRQVESLVNPTGHRGAKRAKRAKPRKRVKSAVQFIGGDFLKNALDEAAQKVKAQVGEAMRTALAGVEVKAIPPPAYRWKMKNGEFIEPSEMEEGHLRNAISFCARRLLSKLSDAVWLEETFTLLEGITELLKEAKRRNLRV